jgi:hypothetical protein
MKFHAIEPLEARIAPATLSIGDARQSEGDSDNPFTFNVTLDAPVSESVTVSYATRDVTALAGQDYEAITSGTLTFEPGENTKQIQVTVKGNTITEGDRQFQVELSNVTNPAVVLGRPTGNGDILDDDRTLTINNAALDEGNAGSASMNFMVSLSAPAAHDVTFRVDTAALTAKSSGPGADFTAITGSLVTIPRGETSAVVAVNVIGDTHFGGDETFQVKLSAPLGAKLGPNAADAIGTGTIRNDETGPAPQLQLIGPTGNVQEGSMAEFKAMLSGRYEDDVIVSFATGDPADTAKPPGDYEQKSGTVTILSGTDVASIFVPVLQDNLAEQADEVFTMKLQSAKLGSTTGTDVPLADAVATAIIQLQVPTLSINDVQVREGNSGTVTASFTVSLSSPTDRDVTFTYTTFADTAMDGSDFTAQTQTVTILQGARSAKVDIVVLGDIAKEGDETFNVQLSAPGKATLAAKSNGVGTIVDDDVLYRIVNPANQASSAIQADEGLSNGVTLLVTRDASGFAGTVRVTTFDGTAMAGPTGDYTALDIMVSFAADEVQKEVRVPLTDDARFEGNEQFTVALSAPTSGIIAPGSGVATVTLVDNEPPPTISVANVNVTEGGNATFTVRLSGVSDRPIEIFYFTQDGTALAGSDYTGISAGSPQSLVIPAGSTTGLIRIATTPDTRVEADETFTLKLQSTSAGTFSDDTATGTIVNNDTVSIGINNVVVVEGNSGQRQAVFTVSLAAVSDAPVTVAFQTANGAGVTGARAGSDYLARAGNLVFAPGELTKTISVPILGDRISELDEAFLVKLSTSTPGAGFSDAEGVGKIVDDERPVVVSLRNVKPAAIEGGDVVYTVSLSRPSDRLVTVEYHTVNGTAIAGSDFAGVSRAQHKTVTFAPGETTKQIIISTKEDLGRPTAEPTEKFGLRLVAPKNAVLNPRANSATGTILDNDRAVASISDVTVVEGDSGPRNAVFRVSLSSFSSVPVSVQFQTVDDSAVGGTDFVSKSGTLVIGAGRKEGFISVRVNGDNAQEFSGTGITRLAQETFTVELSEPKNAVLGDRSGTGTIRDDDNRPTLNIGNGAVVEGDGGTLTGKSIEFTPTLSSPATTAVTFRVSTAPPNLVQGAAQAGVDYVSQSKTMTIPAGGTTPTKEGLFGGPADTFTVTVNGDTVFEATEAFVVRATDLKNAVAGDTRAIGRIYNDDVFASRRLVQWTDTDGELVTLRTDKGNLLRAGFTFASTNGETTINSLGGRSLTELNLSRDEFLHANVRINSSPQPGFPVTKDQDGLVNVGMVRSNNLGGLGNLLELEGVDLGSLLVEGDLQAFRFGDLFNDPSIASLRVRSLGETSPGELSIAVGAITNMRVEGDMRGNLQVVGNRFGDIERLVIDGAIRGGNAAETAAVTDTAGNVTKTIGAITVTGQITNAIIGEVIGGDGPASGSLNASGSFGRMINLNVKGDITGGKGASSGTVVTDNQLANLRVGGDLTGGTGSNSGLIFANKRIGQLQIVGDLAAVTGGATESASIIAGEIGTAKINGSILGGRILVTQDISSLTVLKSVTGTETRPVVIAAGGIEANLALANIVVAGKVTQTQFLAGYAREAQADGSIRIVGVNADAQVGNIIIGGDAEGIDVVAGSSAGADARYGTSDDTILSGTGVTNLPNDFSRIASLVVGGAVRNTSIPHGVVAQQVAAITIGGQPIPLTGGLDEFEIAAGTNFRVSEVQ